MGTVFASLRFRCDASGSPLAPQATGVHAAASASKHHTVTLVPPTTAETTAKTSTSQVASLSAAAPPPKWSVPLNPENVTALYRLYLAIVGERVRLMQHQQRRNSSRLGDDQGGGGGAERMTDGAVGGGGGSSSDAFDADGEKSRPPADEGNGATTGPSSSTSFVPFVEHLEKFFSAEFRDAPLRFPSLLTLPNIIGSQIAGVEGRPPNLIDPPPASSTLAMEEPSTQASAAVPLSPGLTVASSPEAAVDHVFTLLSDCLPSNRRTQAQVNAEYPLSAVLVMASGPRGEPPVPTNATPPLPSGRSPSTMSNGAAVTLGVSSPHQDGAPSLLATTSEDASLREEGNDDDDEHQHPAVKAATAVGSPESTGAISTTLDAAATTGNNMASKASVVRHLASTSAQTPLPATFFYTFRFDEDFNALYHRATDAADSRKRRELAVQRHATQMANQHAYQTAVQSRAASRRGSLEGGNLTEASLVAFRQQQLLGDGGGPRGTSISASPARGDLAVGATIAATGTTTTTTVGAAPAMFSAPDEYDYSLWERRRDGNFHVAAWSMERVMQHFALVAVFVPSSATTGGSGGFPFDASSSAVRGRSTSSGSGVDLDDAIRQSSHSNAVSATSASTMRGGVVKPRRFVFWDGLGMRMDDGGDDTPQSPPGSPRAKHRGAGTRSYGGENNPQDLLLATSSANALSVRDRTAIQAVHRYGLLRAYDAGYLGEACFATWENDALRVGRIDADVERPGKTAAKAASELQLVIVQEIKSILDGMLQSFPEQTEGGAPGPMKGAPGQSSLSWTGHHTGASAHLEGCFRRLWLGPIMSAALEAAEMPPTGTTKQAALLVAPPPPPLASSPPPPPLTLTSTDGTDAPVGLPRSGAATAAHSTTPTSLMAPLPAPTQRLGLLSNLARLIALSTTVAQFQQQQQQQQQSMPNSRQPSTSTPVLRGAAASPSTAASQGPADATAPHSTPLFDTAATVGLGEAPPQPRRSHTPVTIVVPSLDAHALVQSTLSGSQGDYPTITKRDAAGSGGAFLAREAALSVLIASPDASLSMGTSSQFPVGLSNSGPLAVGETVPRLSYVGSPPTSARPTSANALPWPNGTTAIVAKGTSPQLPTQDYLTADVDGLTDPRWNGYEPLDIVECIKDTVIALLPREKKSRPTAGLMIASSPSSPQQPLASAKDAVAWLLDRGSASSSGDDDDEATGEAAAAPTLPPSREGGRVSGNASPVGFLKRRGGHKSLLGNADSPHLDAAGFADSPDAHHFQFEAAKRDNASALFLDSIPHVPVSTIHTQGSPTHADDAWSSASSPLAASSALRPGAAALARPDSHSSNSAALISGITESPSPGPRGSESKSVPRPTGSGGYHVVKRRNKTTEQRLAERRRRRLPKYDVPVDFEEVELLDHDTGEVKVAMVLSASFRGTGSRSHSDADLPSFLRSEEDEEDQRREAHGSLSASRRAPRHADGGLFDLALGQHVEEDFAKEKEPSGTSGPLHRQHGDGEGGGSSRSGRQESERGVVMLMSRSGNVYSAEVESAVRRVVASPPHGALHDLQTTTTTTAMMPSSISGGSISVSTHPPLPNFAATLQPAAVKPTTMAATTSQHGVDKVVAVSQQTGQKAASVDDAVRRRGSVDLGGGRQVSLADSDDEDFFHDSAVLMGSVATQDDATETTVARATAIGGHPGGAIGANLMAGSPPNDPRSSEGAADPLVSSPSKAPTQRFSLQSPRARADTKKPGFLASRLVSFVASPDNSVRLDQSTELVAGDGECHGINDDIGVSKQNRPRSHNMLPAAAIGDGSVVGLTRASTGAAGSPSVQQLVRKVVSVSRISSAFRRGTHADTLAQSNQLFPASECSGLSRRPLLNLPDYDHQTQLGSDLLQLGISLTIEVPQVVTVAPPNAFSAAGRGARRSSLTPGINSDLLLPSQGDSPQSVSPAASPEGFLHLTLGNAGGGKAGLRGCRGGHTITVPVSFDERLLLFVLFGIRHIEMTWLRSLATTANAAAGAAPKYEIRRAAPNGTFSEMVPLPPSSSSPPSLTLRPHQRVRSSLREGGGDVAAADAAFDGALTPSMPLRSTLGSGAASSSALSWVQEVAHARWQLGPWIQRLSAQVQQSTSQLIHAESYDACFALPVRIQYMWLVQDAARSSRASFRRKQHGDGSGDGMQPVAEIVVDIVDFVHPAVGHIVSALCPSAASACTTWDQLSSPDFDEWHVGSRLVLRSGLPNDQSGSRDLARPLFRTRCRLQVVAAARDGCGMEGDGSSSSHDAGSGTAHSYQFELLGLCHPASQYCTHVASFFREGGTESTSTGFAPGSTGHPWTVLARYRTLQEALCDFVILPPVTMLTNLAGGFSTGPLEGGDAASGLSYPRRVARILPRMPPGDMRTFPPTMLNPIVWIPPPLQEAAVVSPLRRQVTVTDARDVVVVQMPSPVMILPSLQISGHGGRGVESASPGVAPPRPMAPAPPPHVQRSRVGHSSSSCNDASWKSPRRIGHPVPSRGSSGGRAGSHSSTTVHSPAPSTAAAVFAVDDDRDIRPLRAMAGALLLASSRPLIDKRPSPLPATSVVDTVGDVSRHPPSDQTVASRPVIRAVVHVARLRYAGGWPSNVAMHSLASLLRLSTQQDDPADAGAAKSHAMGRNSKSNKLNPSASVAMLVQSSSTLPTSKARRQNSQNGKPITGGSPGVGRLTRAAIAASTLPSTVDAEVDLDGDDAMLSGAADVDAAAQLASDPDESLRRQFQAWDTGRQTFALLLLGATMSSRGVKRLLGARPHATISDATVASLVHPRATGPHHLGGAAGPSASPDGSLGVSSMQLEGVPWASSPRPQSDGPRGGVAARSLSVFPSSPAITARGVAVFSPLRRSHLSLPSRGQSDDFAAHHAAAEEDDDDAWLLDALRARWWLLPSPTPVAGVLTSADGDVTANPKSSLPRPAVSGKGATTGATGVLADERLEIFRWPSRRLVAEDRRRGHHVHPPIAASPSGPTSSLWDVIGASSLLLHGCDDNALVAVDAASAAASLVHSHGNFSRIDASYLLQLAAPPLRSRERHRAEGTTTEEPTVLDDASVACVSCTRQPPSPEGEGDPAWEVAAQRVSLTLSRCLRVAQLWWSLGSTFAPAPRATAIGGLGAASPTPSSMTTAKLEPSSATTAPSSPTQQVASTALLVEHEATTLWLSECLAPCFGRTALCCTLTMMSSTTNKTSSASAPPFSLSTLKRPASTTSGCTTNHKPPTSTTTTAGADRHAIEGGVAAASPQRSGHSHGKGDAAAPSPLSLSDESVDAMGTVSKSNPSSSRECDTAPPVAPQPPAGTTGEPQQQQQHSTDDATSEFLQILQLEFDVLCKDEGDLVGDDVITPTMVAGLECGGMARTKYALHLLSALRWDRKAQRWCDWVGFEAASNASARLHGESSLSGGGDGQMTPLSLSALMNEKLPQMRRQRHAEVQKVALVVRCCTLLAMHGSDGDIRSAAVGVLSLLMGLYRSRVRRLSWCEEDNIGMPHPNSTFSEYDEKLSRREQRVVPVVHPAIAELQQKLLSSGTPVSAMQVFMATTSAAVRHLQGFVPTGLGQTGRQSPTRGTPSATAAARGGATRPPHALLHEFCVEHGHTPLHMLALHDWIKVLPAADAAARKTLPAKVGDRRETYAASDAAVLNAAEFALAANGDRCAAAAHRLASILGSDGPTGAAAEAAKVIIGELPAYHADANVAAASLRFPSLRAAKTMLVQAALFLASHLTSAPAEALVLWCIAEGSAKTRILARCFQAECGTTNSASPVATLAAGVLAGGVCARAICDAYPEWYVGDRRNETAVSSLTAGGAVSDEGFTTIGTRVLHRIDQMTQREDGMPSSPLDMTHTSRRAGDAPRMNPFSFDSPIGRHVASLVASGGAVERGMDRVIERKGVSKALSFLVSDAPDARGEQLLLPCIVAMLKACSGELKVAHNHRDDDHEAASGHGVESSGGSPLPATADADGAQIGRRRSPPPATSAPLLSHDFRVPLRIKSTDPGDAALQSAALLIKAMCLAIESLLSEWDCLLDDLRVDYRLEHDVAMTASPHRRAPAEAKYANGIKVDAWIRSSWRERAVSRLACLAPLLAMLTEHVHSYATEVHVALKLHLDHREAFSLSSLSREDGNGGGTLRRKPGPSPTSPKRIGGGGLAQPSTGSSISTMLGVEFPQVKEAMPWTAGVLGSVAAAAVMLTQCRQRLDDWKRWMLIHTTATGADATSAVESNNVEPKGNVDSGENVDAASSLSRGDAAIVPSSHQGNWWSIWGPLHMGLFQMVHDEGARDWDSLLVAVLPMLRYIDAVAATCMEGDRSASTFGSDDDDHQLTSFAESGLWSVDVPSPQGDGIVLEVPDLAIAPWSLRHALHESSTDGRRPSPRGGTLRHRQHQLLGSLAGVVATSGGAAASRSASALISASALPSGSIQSKALRRQLVSFSADCATSASSSPRPLTVLFVHILSRTVDLIAPVSGSAIRPCAHLPWQPRPVPVVPLETGEKAPPPHPTASRNGSVQNAENETVTPPLVTPRASPPPTRKGAAGSASTSSAANDAALPPPLVLLAPWCGVTQSSSCETFAQLGELLRGFSDTMSSWGDHHHAEGGDSTPPSRAINPSSGGEAIGAAARSLYADQQSRGGAATNRESVPDSHVFAVASSGPYTSPMPNAATAGHGLVASRPAPPRLLSDRRQHARVGVIPSLLESPAGATWSRSVRGFCIAWCRSLQGVVASSRTHHHQKGGPGPLPSPTGNPEWQALRTYVTNWTSLVSTLVEALHRVGKIHETAGFIITEQQQQHDKRVGDGGRSVRGAGSNQQHVQHAHHSTPPALEDPISVIAIELEKVRHAATVAATNRLEPSSAKTRSFGAGGSGLSTAVDFGAAVHAASFLSGEQQIALRDPYFVSFCETMFTTPMDLLAGTAQELTQLVVRVSHVERSIQRWTGVVVACTPPPPTKRRDSASEGAVEPHDIQTVQPNIVTSASEHTSPRPPLASLPQFAQQDLDDNACDLGPPMPSSSHLETITRSMHVPSTLNTSSDALSSFLLSVDGRTVAAAAPHPPAVFSPSRSYHRTAAAANGKPRDAPTRSFFRLSVEDASAVEYALTSLRDLRIQLGSVASRITMLLATTSLCGRARGMSSRVATGTSPSNTRLSSSTLLRSSGGSPYSGTPGEPRRQGAQHDDHDDGMVVPMAQQQQPPRGGQRVNLPPERPLGMQPPRLQVYGLIGLTLHGGSVVRKLASSMVSVSPLLASSATVTRSSATQLMDRRASGSAVAMRSQMLRRRPSQPIDLESASSPPHIPYHLNATTSSWAAVCGFLTVAASCVSVALHDDSGRPNVQGHLVNTTSPGCLTTPTSMIEMLMNEASSRLWHQLFAAVSAVTVAGRHRGQQPPPPITPRSAPISRRASSRHDAEEPWGIQPLATPRSDHDGGGLAGLADSMRLAAIIQTQPPSPTVQVPPSASSSDHFGNRRPPVEGGGGEDLRDQEDDDASRYTACVPAVGGLSRRCSIVSAGRRSSTGATGGVSGKGRSAAGDLSASQLRHRLRDALTAVAKMCLPLVTIGADSRDRPLPPHLVSVMEAVVLPQQHHRHEHPSTTTTGTSLPLSQGSMSIHHMRCVRGNSDLADTSIFTPSRARGRAGSVTDDLTAPQHKSVPAADAVAQDPLAFSGPIVGPAAAAATGRHGDSSPSAGSPPRPQPKGGDDAGAGDILRAWVARFPPPRQLGHDVASSVEEDTEVAVSTLCRFALHAENLLRTWQMASMDGASSSASQPNRLDGSQGPPLTLCASDLLRLLQVTQAFLYAASCRLQLLATPPRAMNEGAPASPKTLDDSRRDTSSFATSSSARRETSPAGDQAQNHRRGATVRNHQASGPSMQASPLAASGGRTATATTTSPTVLLVSDVSMLSRLLMAATLPISPPMTETEKAKRGDFPETVAFTVVVALSRLLASVASVASICVRVQELTAAWLLKGREPRTSGDSLGLGAEEHPAGRKHLSASAQTQTMTVSVVPQWLRCLERSGPWSSTSDRAVHGRTCPATETECRGLLEWATAVIRLGVTVQRTVQGAANDLTAILWPRSPAAKEWGLTGGGAHQPTIGSPHHHKSSSSMAQTPLAQVATTVAQLQVSQWANVESIYQRFLVPLTRSIRQDRAASASSRLQSTSPDKSLVVGSGAKVADASRHSSSSSHFSGGRDGGAAPAGVTHSLSVAQRRARLRLLVALRQCFAPEDAAFMTMTALGGQRATATGDPSEASSDDDDDDVDADDGRVPPLSTNGRRQSRGMAGNAPVASARPLGIAVRAELWRLTVGSPATAAATSGAPVAPQQRDHDAPDERRKQPTAPCLLAGGLFDDLHVSWQATHDSPGKADARRRRWEALFPGHYDPCVLPLSAAGNMRDDTDDGDPVVLPTPKAAGCPPIFGGGTDDANAAKALFAMTPSNAVVHDDHRWRFLRAWTIPGMLAAAIQDAIDVLETRGGGENDSSPGGLSHHSSSSSYTTTPSRRTLLLQSLRLQPPKRGHGNVLSWLTFRRPDSATSSFLAEGSSSGDVVRSSAAALLPTSLTLRDLLQHGLLAAALRSPSEVEAVSPVAQNSDDAESPPTRGQKDGLAVDVLVTHLMLSTIGLAAAPVT